MFNLFVKSHDQSQACLSSAMARKRRMKSKVVLYARAKARNNMKRVEEVLRKAKKMDVQRVIDSGIPDVAPVFGGVRGRTLSSRHLKYAWPIIAEAGIKTVIDLRNLDSSNRLVEYCEQYGMEFFHYPVDKKKLNTEVMVDRLIRFCELIESEVTSILLVPWDCIEQILHSLYIGFSMEQTKVSMRQISEAIRKHLVMILTISCKFSMPCITV